MTKLKVKSVLKQRAEEGKIHGILPYGYTKDSSDLIVIDNEEAKIIKLIFKLSLDGNGTNKIAEKLNNKNIPTRYNKIGKGTLEIKNKYTGEITKKNKKDIKWSGNTIRNIIKNKIYTGVRTFGGYSYNVPPIIDLSKFEEVNQNLKKNRNNSGKKVEHKYLLKGLIRCGICNRNMYGRSRTSKKDHYYMCSSKRSKTENCGNRSINIDKIENFIWYKILMNPDFRKKLKNTLDQEKSKLKELEEEIINIEKTIQKLDKQRDKFIEMASMELITLKELAEKSKNCVSKIKDLRLKSSDLKKNLNFIKSQEKIQKKYANDFVKITNEISFRQRKKIIKDFIKNITVSCLDSPYYFIKIEYHHEMKSENFQSENLYSNIFFKIEVNNVGEKVVILLAPTPINNPVDNTNLDDFYDRMEKK